MKNIEDKNKPLMDAVEKVVGEMSPQERRTIAGALGRMVILQDGSNFVQWYLKKTQEASKSKEELLIRLSQSFDNFVNNTSKDCEIEYLLFIKTLVEEMIKERRDDGQKNND